MTTGDRIMLGLFFSCACILIGIHAIPTGVWGAAVWMIGFCVYMYAETWRKKP